MAARPTALRIDVIVERWDMRGVHKLRKDRRALALKSGTCLVAFNKALTIGRIIDYAGGIHTYYAEPKEIFDTTSLSELLQDGFFIDLRLGQKTQQQASRLERAA